MKRDSSQLLKASVSLTRTKVILRLQTTCARKLDLHNLLQWSHQRLRKISFLLKYKLPNLLIHQARLQDQDPGQPRLHRFLRAG
jgi:hypothetical protein